MTLLSRQHALSNAHGLISQSQFLGIGWKWNAIIVRIGSTIIAGYIFGIATIEENDL